MEKLFKSKLLLIGLLFLLLSNCTGDQGEPGPAGADGTDGTDGTDGAGFDEAVKNGNILVYLDGTRPDGIAFKDTLDFKFCPTNVDDYSYAYPYSFDADYDVYFYIERYLAMDDDVADDSYADIYFEPYVDTETGDTLKYFWMDIYSDITTSDFKYFRLDDSYYSYEGEDYYNITDDAFTAFSYDTLTGNVKFKFEFTVPASENSTYYDLNVSGAVDAIVYQYIYCSECGRKAREERIAKQMASRKPVQRAEMKSLK